MANEAICYEAPTRFARYTVSSAAAIPKGSILQLATPNTASITDSDNDIIGGVAWMEKVASPTDPSTEITAALNGVWGMVISTTAGPITVGYDVVAKGVNVIGPYTSLDDEKGYVIGKILETVSSAAATVVKVRMNL